MAEEEIKPTGFITFEERERIIARLKEQGAPKACEMCGTTGWQIGHYIVTPAPITRGESGASILNSDPVHPCAALFCKQCGNTKLFNLGILNLAGDFYKKPDEEND